MCFRKKARRHIRVTEQDGLRGEKKRVGVGGGHSVKM